VRFWPRSQGIHLLSAAPCSTGKRLRQWHQRQTRAPETEAGEAVKSQHLQQILWRSATHFFDTRIESASRSMIYTSHVHQIKPCPHHLVEPCAPADSSPL